MARDDRNHPLLLQVVYRFLTSALRHLTENRLRLVSVRKEGAEKKGAGAVEI